MTLLGWSAIVFGNLVNDSVRESQWQSVNAHTLRLANTLAETPGQPSAWHQTNDFNLPGLVGETRKVSVQKWNAFKNTAYNVLKNKLGLSAEDFSVEIVQNGQSMGKVGLDVNAVWKVNIVRGIEYNSMPARLEVTVYAA